MPGRLSRSEAEGFLKGVQALAKAQSLYPAGHAAIRRARESLDTLLESVFSTSTPLLIGLADGYLVLGDCAFVDGNPQARDLASRLESKGIEGVLVEPGVTAAEIGLFLEWLRTPAAAPWKDAKISLTSLDRSRAQWSKAKRLHGAAVQALKEVDRDILEGRIPDPRKARECVVAFSELLDEKPSVLPGLLLIKDYDNYTFYHSVNVCLLSMGIGRQLGLCTEELDHVGVGGLFHDIGKTRTPVNVLRKPGRLSSDEFDLIRSHPVHGRDILAQMGEFPESSVQVVYEHHMGFNGSGYPVPERADQLHRLTPLVTTADVYDAMTTHRPYQGPRPLPEAIAEMESLRGAHFSPHVLDAFLSLMGTVPVGSLLRLKTGEVAVATQMGRDGQVSTALIVAGRDGRDLPESERSKRDLSPGDVAGWVAPLSRRIDLGEAVKSHL